MTRLSKTHNALRRALSFVCTLVLCVGLVQPAFAANREWLSDHVVTNTVDPSGISLNLFDYWVTDDRDDNDNDTPYSTYKDSGINKTHQLCFLSKNDYEGTINSYVGKNNPPRPGIVKPLLENGYPVLASGNTVEDWVFSREESLDYLFNGEDIDDAKKAFMGVKGLLQIDSSGYYYYNASQNQIAEGSYETANYAAFDETTNRFTLYDRWGVKSSGGWTGKILGQFFPFNDPNTDDVFSQTNWGITQDEDFTSLDNSVNHYFGMSMTTRFIQRYGGRAENNADAKAVTYEFAGDDDVWIFIDGVLVADLGGIHDLATAKIDFETGKIYINGVYKQTLRDAMETYYPAEDYWSDDTLSDDTYHTLKLFYLERGGTDSNLSMKFNLAYVPETEGIKVDQAGNPLAGVGFELYAAKKENGGYVIDTSFENGGLLASGTTDANGHFVLSDGNEAIISLNEFDQRGIKYLILKENNTNEGYRPEQEHYLVIKTDNLEPRNAIMLNDEGQHWQTGSYVSAKKTVMTGSQINLRDREGNFIKTVDLEDGGTAFAVIMRRLTNVGEAAPTLSDEWGVVTGTALGGWNVVRRDGDESYISTALRAISQDPSCYTKFTLSTNGSYMAEIENCPGDIRDYYFWKQDVDSENAKDTAYAISYYYTTGSIEDADASNTNWINSTDFERVFAAKLYIPNVKNYLYVNKIDENGDPLEGAEFALYDAKDVIVAEDGGSYELRDGARPVDTVVTDAEGSAVFPSDDGALVIGDYYMVESRAPHGYTANARPVHVIVNELGVLADAGVEGDGITTQMSLGTLVQTMAQFATADDIDRTLTDIFSTRLRGELNAEGELEFSVDTVDGGETIELSVDTSTKADAREGIQYMPTDPNDKRTGWVTDTGWIWHSVKQNFAAEMTGPVISFNKSYLGDTDITRLFSGKMVVTVQDQPVGTLSIEKTVEAAEGADELPDGELDVEFDFTVTLTEADGETPFTGEIAYTSENGGGTLTFTDGEAFLALKHGERVTLPDIPVGTEWTVSEDTVLDGRSWQTLIGGTVKSSESGSIESAGEADEVSFVNRYIAGTAPDSATLTGFAVSKTFAAWDGDCEDEEFEFTLTGRNGAPLPTGTSLTLSKDNRSDSFGDIEFTEAGEYTYTVREQRGDNEHITYDGTVYTVTVTAGLKDGANELEVKSVAVTVDGDEYDYATAGSLAFENTYTPPAPDSATLTGFTVSKTFAAWNGDCEDEEFEFTLTADDGAPLPAGTSLTLSKDNRSDSFGGIEFTEAGEYTYTVLEQRGDNEHITYDGTVYTVTVTVGLKDGANELEVKSVAVTADGDEYDYETAGSLAFENTYTPPAPDSTTLTGFAVSKTFAAWDGDCADEEFEFTLTADDDAPTPTGTSLTLSADKTSGSFGNIEFTEAGEYTYTVREQLGDNEHITYDDTVYTVTVTVGLKDSANELEVKSVEYTADGDEYDYITAGSLVFENTYTQPAPDSTTLTGFAVSKTFAAWDGDCEDEEFEFTLAARNGAPLPTGTSLTLSEDNRSGSFGDIEFTGAGEYTYTVSEKRGENGNITYDDTVYTVTVTVGLKDGANELEVKSVAVTADGEDYDYETAGSLAFENTYTAPEPDTYTLAGFKVTKRYTPSSQTCREDVGFLLEGSDGAPMPQNDELTINGRGTGSFGSIVFTEEGTYTYTVTEINDRVDGMSYDRTVYTAEVEVYYTEDGELTADVTYTRGGRDYGYDDSGFVFTNAYREEDEEDDTGALRIKKTVSGDGVDPDAEFSFRIEVGDISGVYDGVRFKNGVAEISLKAGESLTINGLPSGEKYTVTELRADGYEVTSRNETGRVTNGGTTTVSFNNHKDAERTPDLDTTDHFAYIIGYPDGTIRPEGNITRAEVATIFFRLLKDEAREANWSQVNDFTDVPADKWYNNAISTLANMGVISGYPDGSFRPDAPITRAELTKIAVGFFAGGEEYYSYNGRFTDVDGSEWYVQSLMKAFDMGIINGYPDGSFGPGRYITRAETCTIINRTIDRHPHAEHLLPRSEMLMWIDNTDSGKWYYAQMQEATNSHDYDMISILGESFEDWTEKLTERDWAALEKSWSDANSAPGGEVIS